MTPYRIRRARPGDTHGIAELEKRCFPTPWKERDFENELSGNPLAVYMAALTGADEIIGYCGLWVILDEGHITNVAVAPEWRKQGVAADLLAALFEEAGKRGARRYTLEVRRSNEDAIRLYEGFGFQIAGYRKGYYADTKEDAAIMWTDVVAVER